MIDPNLSRLARGADFLTAEEERDLLKRAQAGEQPARDRLVLTHMRLATSAALQARHHGVPVDDLAHEGVAGLLIAIDGFDLTQEVRFATYARWWIGARIKDFVVKQAAPVNLAKSAASRAMFFRLRAERAILERTGTLSPAEVETRLAKVFTVSVDQIRRMSAILIAGQVSLNEQMSPDGDERGDFLVDEKDDQSVQAETEIDGGHRRNTLQFALARLSDRERAIVLARHMTDDGAETLKTLGDRFGLSSERVRQIEAKALDKLKSMLNADGTARPVLIAAE